MWSSSRDEIAGLVHPEDFPAGLISHNQHIGRIAGAKGLTYSYRAPVRSARAESRRLARPEREGAQSPQHREQAQLGTEYAVGSASQLTGGKQAGGCFSMSDRSHYKTKMLARQAIHTGWSMISSFDGSQ